MKVLFLDIDGVIMTCFERQVTLKCLPDEYGMCKKFSWPVDTTKVDMLNDFIDKTNCKVVISSSWGSRKSFMKTLIETKLIHNVIGAIELTYSKDRSEEVNDYIDANNNISNFVILDDEDFKFKNNDLLKDNFVKIDWMKGLQADDLKKAYDIIMNKNRKLLKYKASKNF